MKLLLSAYACAPGSGSEPEVGLQALRAAAAEHEVWVLTQPHMAEALRPWLATEHPGARVHVVPVEPAAPLRQDGLPALGLTQWRHEQWQRAAAATARRLHAEHRFDLVHHVTLAAYWMRAGVAELDLPLVWGPVGGAVEPPWQLAVELGARGLLEDAVRGVVRRAFWLRPAVRAAGRGADVVLVQNAATARRLAGSPGPVLVLPNALCARVPAPPAGPRRNDIAVVGRVVAWKAVPLAVRALARLRDRSTVLRVYGEAGGAQRNRVLQAAARHGVAARVDLVGRLPRSELLARVATSGALLHPSLHDEASFTVAEALALGTPVVALAHGGPPHVVEHFPGAVARLVRPGRPAATARALARALDDVLDPTRPVGPGREPDVDFAQALQSAYRRAVGLRTS